MGAKKKKGGRRYSNSDFAGDDAILQDILTSSRTAGIAVDPKSERALAFPPKPLPAPAAVPEPAAKAPEALTNSSAPVDSPDVADLTTDEAEPSELPATAGGEGKCQHVKNAVKLPKLRKGVAHQKDWSHCLGCRLAESKAKKLAQRMDKVSLSESEGSTTGDATGEPMPAESLWMCLSCCEINCGRTIKEHALAHHDGKKNNHPLAINLGTMDCWCYDCDNQIVPSKNRNQVIQECQIFIEKALQIKQSKMRATSATISKKTKGATSETIVAAPLPKAKVSTPGLQNLGNTCFFNSVVQVLTETKSLRSILSEDGGASSGFAKSLATSTDIGLGPLTTTFKEFLFIMWKQQGGTIAPRDLFTQIAKKWKLFRGFRQQDSHELMRYLFDGIKHEELDMIKRHLSEEGGSQHEKADEAKDDKPAGSDEERQPRFVPFIDSCFSGKLVSVIVCDACKKCSYAPEDFFDLSLPIRGPTQAGAVTGSSLKSRFLARSKQDPTAKEAEPKVDNTPADEKDPLPESDQPSDAHLRHVSKLLKSIGPSTSEDLSIQRSLNQFTSVDRLDGENKFACENCYKLIQAAKEKDGGLVEQGDKPDANIVSEEETDVEAATEEPILEVETADTTIVAPESDDDESDEDDDDEETSGQEQTDSLGNTIPKKAKKVESNVESKTESEKPAEAPKYIFRRAFKRYLISNLPPTLVLHLKRFESSGRFGQMRKIEDHVDIPVEIDMAPYFVPKNEIEEEDENENESGSESRKEDVGESQSKKYRLYGAVVHMGTLGGGHYINYVLSSKVQVAEVAKGSAQEKEKAKSKSSISVNGLELPDAPLMAMLTQQKEKAEEKKNGSAIVESSSLDAMANAEESVEQERVPAIQEEDKRQWIACSDSSVRLSSLQEVLASRAYLLFYERC